MTSPQVSEVRLLEEKLAEATGRIRELEQELERRYRRPRPKRTSDSYPDAAGWSESGQRFRRLFEANNIGVVVANSSGLVLEANDYYLNLVGFTQQDLREGRVSWAAVTPADQAPIDEAALRDLRTNGFNIPTEKQYVRPDGSRAHVLISGAMLPGPGDKILALVLDLSEKKRAEQALRESEARFRTLADNIPQLAWMADQSGHIFWLNQRWVEYTGTGLAEMEGSGWRKLPHPAHAERVIKRLERCFETGETWEDTFPLLASDGTYRWFLCRATPILDVDGSVLRWFGTSTDVTEHLETQEALRQTNERLEERVRERTAELTKTVDELQQEILQRLEAEQRLQAAYEQLNVRAGQLRALTAQLAVTEQKERRRLAKVLHDHLQQLLVGAKLRIALLGRTGDAQIQTAASEIEDLLTESIRASRSLTAELSPPILHEQGLQAGLEWLTGWMRETHGLTVTLKKPDTFPRLSPEITLLVFEAVRELLFNVVKHAGVQSATVTVREVDGNLLEVAVSDRGPGFEPARKKAASETGGGFGLFSIRERMNLIDGNAVISTSAGKGTLVLLTIPLSQTADIRSH